MNETFNERYRSSRISKFHETADIQTIMTSYNCECNDIMEAVDLYNLDINES